MKKYGKRFGYYDCKNHDCHFRVRSEEAHEQFMALLGKLALSPPDMERFRSAALSACKMSVDEAGQRRKTSVLPLLQERESLRRYLERTDDRLLQASLRSELERLDREIEDAKGQHVAEATPSSDGEKSVRECTELLGNLANEWKVANVERKSLIQQLLFPEGFQATFAHLDSH